MTTLKDILRDFAYDALKLAKVDIGELETGHELINQDLPDLIEEYIDIICKRLIGQ